jgi:Domain of unknown function (DUF1814).
MLQEQTVEKRTLGILKELMKDAELGRFILVGGTALALQIGHRKSIDLDFFSQEKFDENQINDFLVEKYNFKTTNINNAILNGFIEGVKIDFVPHRYEYVKKPFIEKGIRLASIEDIAAMKLNAIVRSGQRLKDFIDIAYLSSIFTLNQMLGFYIKKYPNSNKIIAIKALGYFEEINHEEKINMADKKTYQWNLIKNSILCMINYPDDLCKLEGNNN